MTLSRRQQANGRREATEGLRAKSNSSAGMNLKEIKELIELITDKGISEFELERSGVRLKISRNTGPHQPGEVVHPADFQPARVPGNSATPAMNLKTANAPQLETEGPPETPAEGLCAVHSPMVGTFYPAPADGEPPFVQIGDKVLAGQVLCIIEAMKLMNEIEVETAGEVVRCYVESGQPVEYGEVLFDIRPPLASRKVF